LSYFSDDELLAQRKSLPTIAEYLEEIGWQRRLLDLTEYEILTLVAVTIGAFQDAQVEIRMSQRSLDLEIPF
jgi:Family of unknown function (DUF6511)